MNRVKLGKTGIEVSKLALGAGPIPELMTEDRRQQQVQVLRHAIDAGINWIDTAATYGGGKSEESLGLAFKQLGHPNVHVATKVRLFPEDLGDIAGAVRRSLEGSLDRLGVTKVTLLQLHNSLTAKRGDEPTSLTPADVLQGGILATMKQLQAEGLVDHLGITGIGQPQALRAVIQSGEFETMQVPFGMANPTAGFDLPDFAEANYGNVIGDCAAADMAVFAIRVYAGGALLDAEPAKHTYTTKFFPLDLYERDRRRGLELANRWKCNLDVQAAAVRFSAFHSQVTSAIVGFSETEHVDQAVRALDYDPSFPLSLAEKDLACMKKLASLGVGP